MKSCLGLGPIFFEGTTPEVIKSTFREIADFRSSETLDQTYIFGASLLNKVQFLNHKPKILIKQTLIQRGHLHNKFSFLALLNNFLFLLREFQKY